jgi:hypothetical protein
MPRGLTHDLFLPMGVLDGEEVTPRSNADKMAIQCDERFTPYRPGYVRLRRESNCPNCGAPVRHPACAYCGTSHIVRGL